MLSREPANKTAKQGTQQPKEKKAENQKKPEKEAEGQEEEEASEEEGKVEEGEEEAPEGREKRKKKEKGGSSSLQRGDATNPRSREWLEWLGSGRCALLYVEKNDILGRVRIQIDRCVTCSSPGAGSGPSAAVPERSVEAE